MSSLAKVVLSRGHTVIGSDRNYDAGRFPKMFAKLQEVGVRMAL